MNAFEFLTHWYQSQCDGEWEHEYGVKIETIDNPGWLVRIDLVFTNLEDIETEGESVENGPGDWYLYSIKNNVFTASGDPDKLERILDIFRTFASK